MSALDEYKQWAANPFTQKLMNRCKSELVSLQKQHNSANYTDLKEVAVVQAKIEERQRFLDDVFVTGSVFQENYKQEH